jgi:cytochrome c554/c'-like protein
MIFATAGVAMSSSKPTPEISLLKHKDNKNDLNILITGNVLSTLKPCGCTTEQLGGFERRSAVISNFPKDKRFVLDTGNFLEKKSELDTIKFSIIFQALSMLGYDLVNLTEDDFETATELDIIDSALFDMISNSDSSQEYNLKTKFKKSFTIADNKLDLTIISAKCDTPEFDALTNSFKNNSDSIKLNILITDNCDLPAKDYLEGIGMIDVVICPAAADEPAILDDNIKKPLFVSVGKIGEYFAKLSVNIKNGKLKLDFSKIPIEEKLPFDQALVQLYKDYQLMVKEEKLLERTTRTPFPGGLEYLGSDSCGISSCHKYEYDIWAKHPHADAYQTLVEVNSQYDPECIECHVVGFGIESGFVNEKSPKDLRNVGCEICHGPASEHLKYVASGQEEPITVDPLTSCFKCHTADHSPEFEAKEQLYRKNSVHWKEQKSPPDVQ